MTRNLFFPPPDCRIIYLYKKQTLHKGFADLNPKGILVKFTYLHLYKDL